MLIADDLDLVGHKDLLFDNRALDCEWRNLFRM